MKEQNSINNGQNWSLNGNKLPDDLLAAENVLSQLAGVFFSLKTSNQQNSQKVLDKELPSVTDTYRILVEQIPAVVFIAFFDKDFGEAYVSPQIEATLGFKQEEWLSDPVRWYQQIHPEDKERWSTEAAQMFLTGEPLRSVYRVLARSGRVVWFHCEVKMVRHEDGRPWFIHGIGFDITEQKYAEEALSKSEEMLRGIFEFAPDTMVVVTDQGNIERVNAQVERMFGYERNELIGQPVEILMPNRFQSKHVKHRSEYIAEPHLRPMGNDLGFYGKRKDGSEFPVEIMLSPVIDKENSLVIGIIRDITKRQQNQDALREYADRMKILSRRLIEVQEAERRNIALELHDEIGQILTGLKLTLEMGSRLPEGELRASLAGAQALVNELMTRTRELSLDLRPATLDHLGLMSALLRHFRHYSSQTQVNVDFRQDGLEGRRFSPELETAAFRIVQEALTNIARHSESEKAIIRIWAKKHKLTIQIEDNGKGFDTEAAFAAHQSSGLAGMRERVLLTGGIFSVESSSGIGTRLTAEWNLSDDTNSQAIIK
ncbi:MAG: PAS domain S-box protein [Actinomycetota bacterium]